MRLQKFLATCGVASRRKSEELIKSGIVKVNNKVITQMGYKIDPQKDKVFIKDEEIKLKEKNIYILLNKPTGYITTTSDELGRRKVTDLIHISDRLFPVGRLDYNTSGLLILTNDGDLTFRLTHPKFEVEKTYVAKARGRLTHNEIQSFKGGLVIDGYLTSPAKLKIIKENLHNSIIEIKIREGRNRQVRKMCEAIGHPVIELKRTAIGDLTLQGLPYGNYRHLNNNELMYLKGL